MSTGVTAILVIIWLAELAIGMGFTIANMRYYRPVLTTALDPPPDLVVDPENVLLARGHFRPEIERMMIFLCYLTVGLAVPVRQAGFITHTAFNATFYGGLLLGNAVLAMKPILVFRDRKQLFRLDAEQSAHIEKVNNS